MKKAEKFYLRCYDEPQQGSNLVNKKCDFIFYKKSNKFHVIYVKYSDDYIEYIMHGLVNNTSKHEAIFVSNGEYNEEISKAFSEAGYNNSDIIRISNKIDKAEKEKVIKKYRRNKR